MKLIKQFLILVSLPFFVIACSNNENTVIPAPQNTSKEVTIFHINDQHGRLDYFSKIKHIIDQEKELTNVMVVCSGDIFSGNPVVDNYEEKGFPMIDLMNKVGFDISTMDRTINSNGSDYRRKSIVWTFWMIIKGGTDCPNCFFNKLFV